MKTKFVLAGLISAALFGGGASSEAQQPLQQIKFGFGNKSVSPLAINFAIPEILGYYKQEGLTVEIVPLGANATSTAMVKSKRIEFSSSTPPDALQLLVKGENTGLVSVMEFVYPFKYGLAVLPDSPIKSVQDMKGKIMGVSQLGVSEYPVGRSIVRLAGLDPDKDISWLAVGENVIAGEALRRKNIDALFYFDTSFATIEAAGIKMRYIPMPPKTPMIGGQFMQTRPDFIQEHRAAVVGMIRAILKTDIFIQENPDAAAYEYIQMYPEAAPKGKSLEEQVEAVALPVRKRAALYTNYTGGKPGAVNFSELRDEIDFANLQDKLSLKDASALYTNDLIEDANKFDPEKIKQDARNFALPYKKK